MPASILVSTSPFIRCSDSQRTHFHLIAGLSESELTVTPTVQLKKEGGKQSIFELFCCDHRLFVCKKMDENDGESTPIDAIKHLQLANETVATIVPIGARALRLQLHDSMTCNLPRQRFVRCLHCNQTHRLPNPQDWCGMNRCTAILPTLSVPFEPGPVKFHRLHSRLRRIA